MSGGGEWRPPFSSGKIVGSYRPLKSYLEAARRRGREDLVEKALISSGDVETLRDLVREYGYNAEDLVSALTERFYDRVDPEIAAEALKDLELEASPETARRMIARILAGWLVEAGEEWKVYRLKRRWG